MNKGWPSRLFPSSMAVVLLAGCALDADRRGATVLYASGADLQSINPLVTVHPLAREVQKHVLFTTLARYDSALVPQPRLATWEWNPSRTVLRLSLRTDVFWHDGRPTTSADVVTTLRLARDTATGYPRFRDVQAFQDVAAPDSFTVVIRFNAPQPGFPDVLTDLPMLPDHVLASVEASAVRTHVFNADPVGNGPYRFVEHRPNQRWVFERVTDFPEVLGAASLDRFVVVVVDEAATKLAALTSGELDFAGISPAHSGFVTDDPRLEVVDYPLQFAVGLVWNLRRPPFDDVRLRRALTSAIDRETLLQAYVNGYGSVADGPVAPGHPWAVAPDPVPYDRDDALETLDALGWRPGADGVRERNGQRLSFEVMAVSSGDNALEQLVQAQLRDVGVEVTLRLLELSTFLDVAQSADRDFDALSIGVSGTVSLGHVAAMYESEAGPLAYPGYRSELFDEAVGRVRRAQTPDQVAAAWAEAQRILIEDHPTTWLYHSRGVQGKNRRVVAPAPDLRGELARIHEWSIRSTNR